jgi:hypothetical protein
MLNRFQTLNDFSDVLYFVPVSGMFQCREKCSVFILFFMLRYVYKDTDKYLSNTVFMC